MHQPDKVENCTPKQAQITTGRKNYRSRKISPKSLPWPKH